MEFVGSSMKLEVMKLEDEDLLSQDHMLIRDVCSDIKWIKDQITYGDDFILCSLDLFVRGNHEDEDEQSARMRRNWAREMRDVAYDAGDFVDRIRQELSRQPEPVVRGFLSAIRMAWYRVSTRSLRRSLADEIHRLRNRVETLVGEGQRNKYIVENNRLPAVENTGGAGGASTSAPHVDGVVERTLPSALLPTGVEEPVGIERAVEDVNSWLTSVEKDPELRVFAIVGRGGLGKTTFAGALLRKFGEHFDSHTMVLASREFNVGGFLRRLLKKIMPPFDYDELQLSGSSDGWKDEELCEKVEEQFLEKRYIVVVDDVWTESSWKSIWKILPQNDKGSRVVLTTRFYSVAQAAIVDHQQGYVYSLDPLNADYSHRLLQRTLGANHICPCQADCPTSVILEKCGGLPLAIVCVSGLLVNRLASGSSLITACGSLSSELENGAAQEENIKNILNLCYNDLPAELKTGFLFLCIFPVGSIISRKRLMRRWIAEGFITNKHGKTLKQDAEELFTGLIRRNLIQPVDISSSGEVKTFQVHDVILENILSKSREENFISIVKINCYSSGLELPQNNVRWLSIHGSCNPLHSNEIMKNMNSLHIRSLTAFGTMNHLRYFEILQVLDLEGCLDLGTDQLSIICKMYLLKYLSLRRTYIRALPSRICHLQCLETLDIRETNVFRLPRNVGRLKQMAHLLGGDRSRGFALTFTSEITKMSKLQTLSDIVARPGPRGSTAGLEGLGNLINLNKLSIYMAMNPAFLFNCSSLTSLSIDNMCTGELDCLDHLDDNDLPACVNNFHILKLTGKLRHVPRWINRMQCLGELTLSLTSLRTDSLVVLSTLPRLCFLSFSVNARKLDPHLLVILQENMSESAGEIFIPACGFQCLRSLCFSGSAIPLLSFLQGSMPALEILELRFKMTDGVYGLQNLANLKKLHLEVGKQASEVTEKKVRQILSSVDNHPRRPMVIHDEYQVC